MRKIKYLIFLLIVGVFSVTFVHAASFKVSANKTLVSVGNSVTVTVSVSGDDADAWEYCLDYDSSVFSLTSSSVGGLGSTSCLNLGGITTGGKSVTFKLKAIKSGSSTITLKGADILDYASNSVLKSVGSVKITAKTQAEIEASYSTNADLKSLSVDGYEITPKFDKNTLEYSLEVENEVESVTIKASKADSSASISGTGDKDLTEGVNKFEIVVTAEKGNKKTYVIEINRKELNPIHVTIDGKEYTVVRKADAMSAPTYYSSTEIELQNELVPAYKSDITGYVLVGLKDSNGNISLYRYNDSTEEFVYYKQVCTEEVTLVALDADTLIEGYELVKNVTINNLDINGYVGNTSSDFVLVYGMNASTGEIGWYKYDTKENTLQRYEVMDNTASKEELDMYFILTIVFVSLSLVTILLVIVLLSMNSKLRKKNSKLISMLESNRNKGNQELQGKKEEVKEEVEQKEIIAKEEAFKEEETKEKEELSKREQRRLEKEKLAKEQEELRKMQEDFLKTEANEIIVDDVELEESTPIRKRGRKKK